MSEKGVGNAAGEPTQDVICFAAQDWWYHNRAHSDVQLMRRVAEHRKVLLVNSIGLRMPLPGRSSQVWRRLGRKLRSLARSARRPDPGRPDFIVYTPLVLPFYSSAKVRRLNAALLRWQLLVLIRLFGLRDPLYVVTLPTAWDVVRRMRPRGAVFNRSDKQSAFPEVDRVAIEALETSLLTEADAVLYVSHALLESEAHVVGDRAVFLDHGVDLDHFVRGVPAAEVSALPGPRVGFFGSFDDYTVDAGLLERLAVEIPEMSLVLIGSSTMDLSHLTQHPNVHWLGYRPYEEIPSYGSGFDVAIMPWLKNEWIDYCNPIKLKEYLALGLPIVTTPFPEAKRYGDVLEIAETPEDFVAAVRARLARGDTEEEQRRRRQRVSADSWDQRARDLLRIADAVGGEHVRDRGPDQA